MIYEYANAQHMKTLIPFVLILMVACSKDDVDTRQLVTWLAVPDNYSLEELRSVVAVGDSININIPKYKSSSTQSLYYIKSFNQVGVYKNYSGDPPQQDKNIRSFEDIFKYMLSYTFFIRRNVEFRVIKLNF